MLGQFLHGPVHSVLLMILGIRMRLDFAYYAKLKPVKSWSQICEETVTGEFLRLQRRDIMSVRALRNIENGEEKFVYFGFLYRVGSARRAEAVWDFKNQLLIASQLLYYVCLAFDVQKLCSKMMLRWLRRG